MSEQKGTMYDRSNLQKMEKLAALAPEAFAGFKHLDEAAYKAGALSVKHKELIAVAVATTTQCPYCIDIHAKKARAAGATDAEIAEAGLVAAAIRAGGAVTHTLHAIL